MLGTIYARGKCLICGGKYINNEKREVFHCLDHTDQVAAYLVVDLPLPPEQRIDGKRRLRASFPARDYQKAVQLLNHYNTLCLVQPVYR